jgi:ubiquitin carboxyl-terminal hydrolase 7
MLVSYYFKTDFRTENRERFFDIQLGIAGDLITSLDEYVAEQILDQDNMYRTDFYGEQPAKKGTTLPTQV